MLLSRSWNDTTQTYAQSVSMYRDLYQCWQNAAVRCHAEETGNRGNRPICRPICRLLNSANLHDVLGDGRATTR